MEVVHSLSLCCYVSMTTRMASSDPPSHSIAGRHLVTAVGGTLVMLGLVAMANTVDSLYASIMALVCLLWGKMIQVPDVCVCGCEGVGVYMYNVSSSQSTLPMFPPFGTRDVIN